MPSPTLTRLVLCLAVVLQHQQGTFLFVDAQLQGVEAVSHLAFPWIRIFPYEFVFIHASDLCFTSLNAFGIWQVIGGGIGNNAAAK